MVVHQSYAHQNALNSFQYFYSSLFLSTYQDHIAFWFPSDVPLIHPSFSKKSNLSWSSNSMSSIARSNLSGTGHEKFLGVDPNFLDFVNRSQDTDSHTCIRVIRLNRIECARGHLDWASTSQGLLLLIAPPREISPLTRRYCSATNSLTTSCGSTC